MSRAADLLDTAQAVLLDFDGPITPLMPAPANLEAANAARKPLLSRGVPLAGYIATTTDHLAVLRWAATNAPDALHEVEKQCDEAEITSALTAKPTRGTAELLAACQKAQKPVIIVSNNSERAIRAYVQRWRLLDYLFTIVGRPAGRPDLMKPHTHTVDRALGRVSIAPAKAVLIGDSVSDVEVSRSAGVPCIGFAKTRERGSELREAGAAAIIESMSSLTR